MKIFINSNTFNTREEALSYINESIMTEGSFTDWSEAKEYLKENFHDIYVGLKCPFCGADGDVCGFPDLFYEADEDDFPEQCKYQYAIQKAGYNIVTCGCCGDVFIHEIKELY